MVTITVLYATKHNDDKGHSYIAYIFILSYIIHYHILLAKNYRVSDIIRTFAPLITVIDYEL